MSSGAKQLVFNGLERALSSDQMRAQAFAGAALSTVFQALLDNNSGFDDVNAGGMFLINTTQGTPAYAEVLSGFVFVPTNASSASVVTGGVLFLLDPDASPSADDSQYKLIVDPGTTGLALAPNSSGAIRIDVIECARVTPDTVIETDNRDVFNPTTGLFSAASVNKVTSAFLQYRIRSGVPGTGYPGAASGWMPIAIASVPSGTTTWDTVTLWDVRPLLEDRVRQPFNVSYDMPRGRSNSFYTFQPLAGFWMSGLVECAYAQRMLGGRIQRGSPGADTASLVDLTDAANREASFSTANGLKHFYLLTPFGLPRWARYLDASAGIRLPRSPRGIPLLSSIGPAHAYGVPSAAITFPSVFGFAGASTYNGICIASIEMLSTTLHMQTCAAGKVGLDLTATPPVTTSSFGGASTTFTLAENTHMPAGIRRVHLKTEVNFTVAAGDTAFINPTAVAGLTAGPTTSTSATQFCGHTFTNTSASVQSCAYQADFWIELPTAYPLTTPGSYAVTVNYDAAAISIGTTWSSASLQVIGWEY